MTLEEYISVVCDQLEMLPPSVVIQRLTGDGDRQMLIGPLWSLKKLVVINEIDKELFRRGSWQGKRTTAFYCPRRLRICQKSAAKKVNQPFAIPKMTFLSLFHISAAIFIPARRILSNSATNFFLFDTISVTPAKRTGICSYSPLSLDRERGSV